MPRVGAAARVRLRALDDEPDAFGSSVATERDHDEAAWRRLAGLGPWWVAVAGDDESGSSAGGAATATTDALGVLDVGEERWRGARSPVRSSTPSSSWARIGEGAIRLGLDVTDRVPRARRFYERYGFVATASSCRSHGIRRSRSTRWRSTCGGGRRAGTPRGDPV